METIENNIWQKSRLLIKGLIIGVLVLLLLIPAYFVQNLIKEREERQKEAVTEINSKWAGRQNIIGPVLVIPYRETAVATDGKVSTIDKGIQFSTRITLNGSEQLSFTPVGKETNVELISDWPDPSFTGNQLPDTSSVNGNGFVAKWRSLSHTRNFPQQWKNDTYNLSAAAFNADLFIPVSSYQKTMRSIKYAILCILLTFTAFFLIETTNKKSVHPVHYALIGFALILFYTLLLSFSEYTGFNAAYSIAAIATAGLITWFVKGLLGSMKLSMLLSFVLVLLYSYVFTILQLQDYALLLGSIGLFLTLAVVMYFSRKIQW